MTRTTDCLKVVVSSICGGCERSWSSEVPEDTDAEEWQAVCSILACPACTERMLTHLRRRPGFTQRLIRLSEEIQRRNLLDGL